MVPVEGGRNRARLSRLRVRADIGGHVLRVRRAGFDGRAGGERRAGARAQRVLLSAILAVLASLAVAASASAFEVRGSVEQVDVTGLAPNATASLVKGSTTVATQNADEQGGLLFREVKPGKKYRVRSGGEESEPITVHKDASAPWDPSVYEQEIPDNGYTYLTTRDGTKLAIDVHPPTSPAG